LTNKIPKPAFGHYDGATEMTIGASMKRFFAVCCAVLFLCAAIWAADQKADFSGTWLMDDNLSDKAPKNIDTSLTAGGGGGGMMGGGGGGGMMGGGGGMMGGGMGGFGGPGFGGPGRGPSGPSKTVVITQNEKEIQIANKGAMNGQDAIETFKLDQKEIKETTTMFGGKKGTKVTKYSLGKSKFSITTKEPAPFGGGTSFKGRDFELSKDGKTMTLKINTKGGMGGPTLQKIVYNKQ
jgi:hypothetical protein